MTVRKLLVKLPACEHRLCRVPAHLGRQPRERARRPLDRPGAGRVPRPRAAHRALRPGRRVGASKACADPINFGMNACAGLAPEEMKGWVALRGHPPRRLRPAARLERDGPRRRRRRGAVPDAAARRRRSSPTTTPSYHLAMVRAYNDWLSEYVAYAPERFGGLALLPEPRRRGARSPRSSGCSTGPASAACVMGCYPNGTLAIEPEDDTVCGALAERGVPLSIHVSLTQHDARRAPRAAARLRPLLRRARTA